MDKRSKRITGIFAGLALVVVAVAVLSSRRSVPGVQPGPGESAGTAQRPGPTGALHRIDSPLLERPAQVRAMGNSAARLRSDRQRERSLEREYLPDADGRTAATLQSLQAELGRAETSEAKLDLIEQLSALCHPQALPIVRGLLGDADPEVRAEALWALQGYTDPAIVPLVIEALNDADPEVREAALSALVAIKDPVVKEPLEIALEDPEESVREMAAEAGVDLGLRIRLELLERSMNSKYPDVKMNAVEQLEDMASPHALDLLLTGLRDSSPEVREFVNQSIYFLISESFDSYDAAKSWWDANRNRYDESLFEKD